MVVEFPPSQTFWQCQRCTACCRWPGDVKVGPAEITEIATFLNLRESAFVERYTRLRTDRAGLSLIEQADDSCIFLNGKDCLINEVKPRQCREFPNKWNFPGWRQVCHAIPVSLKSETAEKPTNV